MQKPDFIKRGRRYTPLTAEQLLVWQEYQRWYKTDHTNQLRLRVLAALGGKCIKCGFDDVRALQIDHVNGGGNREHENLPRYSFLKKVEKSIQDGESLYQCLCANCNWIKKFERKEL